MGDFMRLAKTFYETGGIFGLSFTVRWHAVFVKVLIGAGCTAVLSYTLFTCTRYINEDCWRKFTGRRRVEPERIPAVEHLRMMDRERPPGMWHQQHGNANGVLTRDIEHGPL